MTRGLTGCAEYRYLLWRSAHERHGVAPWSLAGAKRADIEAQALRACQMMLGALTRIEAKQAPAPAPETVAAMVASFGSDTLARQETLRRCRLDEAQLRDLVAADLRAEWVIRRLIASVSVSESAVREHYEKHAAQRLTPELRTARHILVTVNEDFIENRRESAHARLVRAAEQWPATDFATLASRVSECPSALEGGFLGQVRRGQLYPALEQPLFRLAPGEMSGIVESPLGFHLLHCDAVAPPREIGFHEAAPAIRRRLQDKARRELLQSLRDGIADATAT